MVNHLLIPKLRSGRIRGPSLMISARTRVPPWEDVQLRFLMEALLRSAYLEQIVLP